MSDDQSSPDDQSSTYDELDGFEEAPLDEEAVSELVREVLVQISRTQLAAKLYTTNNKTRLNAFEKLVTLFDEALAVIDPVLVVLEPDRVTWNGHNVYDPREYDNSFVLRMFRDGIRQLAFTKGITREELDIFVDLLRPGPSTEMDTVDSLWEAGFKHIAHVAVDGFTEAFELPEDERNTEDLDGAKPAIPRFQRLVEALSGLGAARESQEEVVVGIDFTTVEATQLDRLIAVGATAEERTSWSADLNILKPAQMLSILEDHILGILSGRGTDFLLDEAVWLSTGLVLQRLLAGEFGETLVFLGRVEENANHTPQHALVANEVLTRAGSEETLDLICDPDGPTQDNDKAQEAIAFYTQRASFEDSALLARAAVPISGPPQTVIVGILADRIKTNPSVWVEALHGFDGTIAARVLESLVDDVLLPASAEDLFWAAFEHDEPQVRTTAISLFPGEYSERLRDRMIKNLGSPDSGVRCASLKVLGNSGDSTVGIYLLDRARKSGLMNMEAEELDLLLIGLVNIGGERYVPFFRQQLEEFGVIRGALLLNRDLKTLLRVNKQVRSILTALSGINATSAVELLREVRKNSRGKLRDLADELWRKMVLKFSDTQLEESGAYSAVMEESGAFAAHLAESGKYKAVDGKSGELPMVFEDHERESGHFPAQPIKPELQHPDVNDDLEWQELKEILDRPVSRTDYRALPAQDEGADWKAGESGLFGRVESSRIADVVEEPEYDRGESRWIEPEEKPFERAPKSGVFKKVKSSGRIAKPPAKRHTDLTPEEREVASGLPPDADWDKLPLHEPDMETEPPWEISQPIDSELVSETEPGPPAEAFRSEPTPAAGILKRPVSRKTKAARLKGDSDES